MDYEHVILCGPFRSTCFQFISTNFIPQLVDRLPLIADVWPLDDASFLLSSAERSLISGRPALTIRSFESPFSFLWTPTCADPPFWIVASCGLLGLACNPARVAQGFVYSLCNFHNCSYVVSSDLAQRNWNRCTGIRCSIYAMFIFFTGYCTWTQPRIIIVLRITLRITQTEGHHWNSSQLTSLLKLSSVKSVSHFAGSVSLHLLDAVQNEFHFLHFNKCGHPCIRVSDIRLLEVQMDFRLPVHRGFHGTRYDDSDNSNINTNKSSRISDR